MHILTFDDLMPTVIGMVIALFGGVAQLVHFTPKTKKITLRAFIAGSFISTFTGFVVYYFLVDSQLTPAQLIVAIAIGGYTAPAMLNGIALTLKHVGESMKPPEPRK